MSERCPECGSDLVELRREEQAEEDTSSMDLYSPDFYWEFYGYWCSFCEKMYEPHSKHWLEPWQSEEKKKLDGQVQSLQGSAKIE